MVSLMNLSAKVLLFAAFSSALPWDGIVATETIYHGVLDKQPPGPTQAAIARPELFRKGASNEICGFSADGTTSTATLTCDFGALCATNSLGGFGCIKSNFISSEVPLATSCVDSTNFNECGSDCLSNSLLAFCTSSDYPYCLSTVFDYPDLRATAYSCGDGGQTTESELYTLTDGFLTAASPVYVKWDLTTRSISSTTTSLIPTTTMSTLPTTSPVSTNSIITPTSTSTSTPKKTPVGAIAGGAVGGVFVIAAAIFAIIICMRRRKKRQAGDTAPPAAPYNPQMSQPEQQQPFYPQQIPQQQYAQPGPLPQQSYFLPSEGATMDKPATSPAVYSVPGSPEQSKAGYSQSEGISSPRDSIAPPYSPVRHSGAMSPASQVSELHARPAIHEM